MKFRSWSSQVEEQKEEEAAWLEKACMETPKQHRQGIAGTKAPLKHDSTDMRP
jgi:hypothetical protein